MTVGQWLANGFNSTVGLIMAVASIYGLGVHILRRYAAFSVRLQRLRRDKAEQKKMQLALARHQRPFNPKSFIGFVIREIAGAAAKWWWVFGAAAVFLFSSWVPSMTRIPSWTLWLFVVASFILFDYWIRTWVRGESTFSLGLFTIAMIGISFAWVIVAYSFTVANQLRLRHVLVFLVYIVFPVVWVTKLILDEGKSRIQKAGIGVTLYLCSFLYMSWMVGLYNGKKDILKGHLSEHIPTVLSMGAKYLLGFQDEPYRGIAPLVEYMIGLLFNTMIVGFFISYVASLVYSDLEVRRQRVLSAEQAPTPPVPDVTFTNPPLFVPNPLGGCNGKIKGVVKGNHRRYYYLPGDAKYDAIKACYCFETEEAAKAQGFTRATR